MMYKDTLCKLDELANDRDLEGMVNLRNVLTRNIKYLRQMSREDGLLPLDSKALKEMHFERDVVRNFIGQMRRKGKVTKR